jgi:anti-anti-sigma regulatory factor
MQQKSRGEFRGFSFLLPADLSDTADSHLSRESEVIAQVEGTSPSTHIRSRFPLHPSLWLWMEHPSSGKVISTLNLSHVSNMCRSVEILPLISTLRVKSHLNLLIPKTQYLSSLQAVEHQTFGGAASGINFAQTSAERRRRQMMRITRQQDGETITLKIEGCLAGELVSEMKCCWDEVKTGDRRRAIRIDLNDVTFIDAAGRELLAQIFASGAIAGAANVMTRTVVEQFASNEQVNQSGQSGQSGQPGMRKDLEQGTKRT